MSRVKHFRPSLDQLEGRCVPATAVLSGGVLTITGTTGDDVLTVRQADNLLSVDGTPIQFRGSTVDSVSRERVAVVRVLGLDGNDRIDLSTLTRRAFVDAGAGDDIVLGGLTHDFLIGGDGNDQLDGGRGNDALFGGAGTDVLRGGIGNDLLSGGAGNDDLAGGEGNDFLVGGLGDDTLSGDAGNDRLLGESGSDSLFGGDGDDFCSGGSGNDRLRGGNGRDDNRGGDGDDDLLDDHGGRMSGGRGRNRVEVRSGRGGLDDGPNHDLNDVRREDRRMD